MRPRWLLPPLPHGEPARSLWHQFNHIGKGITRGFQHHDSYLEGRQVLLVREVLIHRYEYIELLICSAKHFPAAQPCQPFSGTVTTSKSEWKCDLRRRSTFSSSRIRGDGVRRFSGMGFRVLQGHFEVSLGLLSINRRESLEKSVERFPGFQVVDQGLDGNASTCKYKFSAEYVGVARNDTFCTRGTVSVHDRRSG